MLEIHQRTENDDITRTRIWKLFSLLSRMLFHKVTDTGQSVNEQLRDRIRLFDQGRWIDLIHRANHTCADRLSSEHVSDEDTILQQKIRQASRLIEKGELSHAAHILKSQGLACGNADTLEKL